MDSMELEQAVRALEGSEMSTHRKIQIVDMITKAPDETHVLESLRLVNEWNQETDPEGETLLNDLRNIRGVVEEKVVQEHREHQASEDKKKIELLKQQLRAE